MHTLLSYNHYINSKCCWPNTQVNEKLSLMSDEKAPCNYFHQSKDIFFFQDSTSSMSSGPLFNVNLKCVWTIQNCDLCVIKSKLIKFIKLHELCSHMAALCNKLSLHSSHKCNSKADFFLHLFFLLSLCHNFILSENSEIIGG